MSADIKSGFIVSSVWMEQGNSSYIELFARSKDRELYRLRFDQESFVLFVQQDSDIPGKLFHTRKELPLKAFNKKPVSALYTKKQSQYLELKEYLSQNAIRSFENDLWPQDRFLMERFIFGDIHFSGPLNEQERAYINPQLKAGTSDELVFQLLSIDIETGVKGEIYSIGVSYFGLETMDRVYMLTDGFTQEDEITKFYFSEKDMIQAFLKDFHRIDPDILIGWHVIGFDLNFMIRRCERLGIEFELSRSSKRMNMREGPGGNSYIEIPGRSIIDGPKAMKAMFLEFENLKLETVASSVLGSSKDIASDAGKVEEIERRFREDKMALAKYNLLDCTLVRDLYLKLEVLDFYLARTRNSGLLFNKLGISTMEFDYSYLPLLHRKGYVAPNSTDFQREEQSTGGYVLEPEVGLHRNIAIFDFKSLYPSIIRTFKIDPLSLQDSETDPCTIPNGFQFSTTRHILPDIIEKLMEKRELAKQRNNQSMSQAIKILMNSFYGVMGTPKSRFYHSDLPSAITLTGQWIIKKTIEFLENHNIKTIYGDTDSIFVDLNTSRFSAQEIQEQVNQYLTNLLETEFSVKSHLELEHECIFDQLFFAPVRDGGAGAKKKYIGMISGEMHFKGMEMVRSDWTELAKDFQEKLFTRFFAGEDIEQFIRLYLEDIKSGVYDDKLVYRKRLSKDISEYTKNIPVHVRAAQLINHTGPYRLKEVFYCITKNGPIPVDLGPSNFDYEHYIEKQIKPIADQVLLTQGSSYDAVFSGKQLDLLSF